MLPALSIVIASIGTWAIGMRGMMVTVEGEDYMTFAEAKGLKPGRLFFRYGMRTAILPQVTALALYFGQIVTGAVLVEIVFTYPGLGTLLLDSIKLYDYPDDLRHRLHPDADGRAVDAGGRPDLSVARPARAEGGLSHERSRRPDRRGAGLGLAARQASRVRPLSRAQPLARSRGWSCSAPWRRLRGSRPAGRRRGHGGAALGAAVRRRRARPFRSAPMRRGATSSR